MLGAVVVAISQFQIGFTVSFTNVSQQVSKKVTEQSSTDYTVHECFKCQSIENMRPY